MYLCLYVSCKDTLSASYAEDAIFRLCIYCRALSKIIDKTPWEIILVVVLNGIVANLSYKRGEHKRRQLPHQPLEQFYKYKLVTVRSKSRAVFTRHFSSDAQ